MIVLTALGGTLLAAGGTAMLSARGQQAELETIGAKADMVRSLLIPAYGAVRDMQVDVIQVQQFLTDASATHHRDSFDDAEKYHLDFGAKLKLARDLFGRFDSPEDMTRVNKIRAALEPMDKAFETYDQIGVKMANVYIAKGTDAGNVEMEKFDPVADGLSKNMDDILGDAKALVDSQMTAGVSAGASAIADARVMTLRVGGWVVFGLFVAMASLWMLLSFVARPMRRLAADIRQLSSGDLTLQVSETGRGDEIGEIARATEGFRDAAIAKQRLEQEAAQQRRAAEAARETANAEKAQSAAEREAAAQRRAKEQADLAAEREAIAAQQAVAIEQIDKAISKLASKDVSYRIAQELSADYEPLRKNFNAALEQLASAFAQVSATAESVNGGTQEIAIAANDLSKRTEQQASSLEESAAALSEISTTAKKTAAGAKEARVSVANAMKDAGAGGEVVRKASGAMGRIEDSSRKIGDIIGVIDEIAFQTNLLALNAGVEAARAGDAGRGFAVVAQEVRALAQRAAEAAKEIKGLITASGAQVVEGVALVNETGRSLVKIEQSFVEIDRVISAIAADADAQAAGLGEVNSAINQMDQMTQQNASMAEQATAASRSLATEGQELSRLVGQFNTRSSDGRDLRRELEKAAPHAFGGGGKPAPNRPGAAPQVRSPAMRQPARRVAGSTAAQSAAVDPESWSQF
jgi:methyl-accepting chemotaxis protein